MTVRMVTGKCRFSWGFNLKPGLISEAAMLAEGILVSNLLGLSYEKFQLP